MPDRECVEKVCLSENLLTQKISQFTVDNWNIWRLSSDIKVQSVTWKMIQNMTCYQDNKQTNTLDFAAWKSCALYYLWVIFFLQNLTCFYSLKEWGLTLDCIFIIKIPNFIDSSNFVKTNSGYSTTPHQRKDSLT